MKRGILLLAILMLNLASAEIMIFETGQKYNIGDNILLNFSIQKQAETGAYVETYLVCEDKELVSRNYVNFNSYSPRNFSVTVPALKDGNCSIEVSCSGESRSSNGFFISDSIGITATLSNKEFFPEERIFLNGTAIKANGKSLNGFVEISYGDLDSASLNVQNGTFSAVYVVKKGMAPGEYNLKIRAYEKDRTEQIINQGLFSTKFSVKQVPSSILLDSADSVKPPSNISATISLLDQSGKTFENGSIIVKLFDPSDNIASIQTIKSKGTFFYYLFDNASRSSSWKIRAYYGNIFSEKPVFIEENRKLSYEIIGDSIKIKNIGNVDYSDTVSIQLNPGEHNLPPLNVSLSPGSETEYILSHEGTYDITIDNKTFFNQTIVKKSNQITGDAISADIKIDIYSYIWIAALLLLCLVIYLLTRKFKKVHKADGKHVPEKIKEIDKTGAKHAFLIFLKIAHLPTGIKELADKENLTLSKVTENLYYILFYRNDENCESFAYSICKKSRQIALMSRNEISIVLNSSYPGNKIESLKEFSSHTRKMIDSANNETLVCEDVKQKLNLAAKKKLIFRKEGQESIFYSI